MQAILNLQQLNEHNNELMSLALYGYGCFTSFYVKDGKVKGLELHLKRLHDDAIALFGYAGERDDIINNVKQFLAQADSTQAMGIRVTLFPAEFSLARPGTQSKLNVLVTGRSAASLRQM